MPASAQNQIQSPLGFRGKHPDNRDAARRHGRGDRLFFSLMALVILASVFLGFARTYYLAGLFRAPLPNLLVHIHSLVFSLWILLLVAQTSLVRAGRVAVHRRLGLLGFGLAGLMIVLGLLVATDFEVRHFVLGPAGVRARAFYTVPLMSIFIFATLVTCAFRYRRDPAAHKRFILIATIALLDAAFVRWPIGAAWWGHRAASFLCTIPLLLVIAGYDCWSRGKVHSVTLWAGLTFVALQQLRDPIGYSAAWQAFAESVQIHASSLHI